MPEDPRYEEAWRDSEKRVIRRGLEKVGDTALSMFEEIKIALARWIDLGHQVEKDCNVYGLAAFQRINGEIRRVDPAKVRFQVIDPTSRRSTLNRLADMAEEEPHRELTDAEEQAEERTWD